MNKELEKINAQISSLRAKSNKLWQEVEKLESDRIRLFAEVIYEEQMLSKGQWRFHASSLSLGFSLTCNLRWDNFPELVKLLNPDHHAHYELMQDNKGFSTVQLHFSDGELSLEFSEVEVGKRFIRDFGITVDLSSLEKRKEEAKEVLSEIEELLKTAQIVAGKKE